MGHSIADTFTWCSTCQLCDKGKQLSNYGGECCTLKKKRPAGKQCDFWMRYKGEIEPWYGKENQKAEENIPKRGA